MLLQRRTILGSALALAGTAAGARAQGQGGGPIRIACVGPMTGQYAAFGTQMRAGVRAGRGRPQRQAAASWAASSRWRSATTPATRARRSRSRTSSPAAASRFVAGHFCSGSSIPASKAYAEEGVLQISPASTNPRFTDEGGWNTFRTCGRDDQQGQVAGAYIAKEFRGKKVAILHDNSAYGKGLADETKKALNAAGQQEALYAAYTPGERDYNAIVSRMKGAGVDVIYIGGYHTEAGLILRQAKEQGDERDAHRRRRAGDQRVLADLRRRGRGHADDLLLRPAPPPAGGRGGAALPGEERRSRGLRPLHLRRHPDLGAGRRQDQEPRPAPDRGGAEGAGPVADRARRRSPSTARAT